MNIMSLIRSIARYLSILWGAVENVLHLDDRKSDYYYYL